MRLNAKVDASRARDALRARSPRTSLLRAAVASAAGTVLAAGLLAVPSAHADPEPTAKDVREAFAKVEKSSEDLNRIKETIKSAEADIEAMRDDIRPLRDKIADLQGDLGSSIASQVTEQPLGPTVSLLTSDDKSAFVDGLASIQAMNSKRSDDLAHFTTLSLKLKQREKLLDQRLNSLQQRKAKAAAKEKKLKARYQEAQNDYDELQASEQEEADGGPHETTEADTPPVKASGNVKKAIEYAMSHVGDTYTWGGTGPHTFDCSGLTMKAYEAAGINIGRVTYDQVKKGKGVSMSNVKPGDLVFFEDLSHVGMYVGNGKVVNAARPGVGVVVSPLSGYSIARRIG